MPPSIRARIRKAAATTLLDGALKLAGDGSWERMLGRAWYLGGEKAKGQEIFDSVTGNKKVKNSDCDPDRPRLRRSRRLGQGAADLFEKSLAE